MSLLWVSHLLSSSTTIGKLLVVTLCLKNIKCCVNSRPIWKMAAKRVESSPSSSNNSLVVNQKRMHLRLAFIMSLTVVEFIIFQLPMSFIIIATLFEKKSHNFTIGKNGITIGYVLWCIDSMINPLWTTLLTKSRKVSGTQSSAN